MLLFVLSALTIFHFAVPARGRATSAALGLLWIALIFTALLGLTRAFVPEREQGLMDALVLAPCDRSAIWVAKSLAVFAFLGARGARRAARVLELLLGHRLEHGRRGRAREHRHLRRRHAHRRDGGRRRAPASCSCRCSSCRSRSRSSSAASARARAPAGSTWPSSALYDAIFVLLAWAAFEYVVAET